MRDEAHPCVIIASLCCSLGKLAGLQVAGPDAAAPSIMLRVIEGRAGAGAIRACTPFACTQNRGGAALDTLQAVLSMLLTLAPVGLEVQQHQRWQRVAAGCVPQLGICGAATAWPV